MRTCTACGRQYEEPEGIIGDLDFCHPDGSIGPTCYSGKPWSKTWEEFDAIVQEELVRWAGTLERLKDK